LNQENVGTGVSKEIQRLNDITPATVTAMLDEMTTSDTTLKLYDIDWAFMIVPTTIQGGSADTFKKPSWALKTDLGWDSYSDARGPISCAAVAVCMAIDGVDIPSRQYSQGEAGKKRLTKDAREMQTKMGWDKYVTMQDLEKVVQEYPKCRLTCLTGGERNFGDYTTTGAEFEPAPFASTFTSKKPNKYYLYLYLDVDQKHYIHIPHPAGFYTRFYKYAYKFCHDCIVCFRPAKNRGVHKCRDTITFNNYRPVKCPKCGVYDCGDSCSKTKCPNCQAVYNKTNASDFEHRCIFMGFEKEDKGYNMGENDGKRPSLWVYDLESCIEKKETVCLVPVHDIDDDGYYLDNPYNTLTNILSQQKPNLVYAKNVFTNEIISYFGETCVNEFITFILNHNRGNSILLAHNAAGYDTRLIFEEVTRRPGAFKIKPLLNGCKFQELKIAKKVLFRDSRTHFGGSIKSLAKDYGCLLGKEIFPHLFNSAENYDYSGPLPDKKYYDVTCFRTSPDVDEYADFQLWYAEESMKYNDSNPWVFRDKLFEYCKNDVDVLADVVLKYHEIYYEKFQMSPWKYMTSSSYFHEVAKIQITRKLELPEIKSVEYESTVANHALNDHWAVLKTSEYTIVRKALRGGRTGIGRVLTELSPEQIARGCTIKYFDVVSLYPYHQIAHNFPVGTPTIHIFDDAYTLCRGHTGTLKSVCECKFSNRVYSETCKFMKIKYEHRQWTQEEILNNPNFHGFVVATVQPPTNMIHPLLIHYDEDEKKCHATCEKLVEQAFTSAEFVLALRNGYTLEKLHRYDEYKMAPPLWEDFVKQMYIFKLVNSRSAPEGQELAEMIEEYDMLFDMGDDIAAIPKEQWGKNPAKKSAAKTGLNSGWGKHAQRPQLEQSIVIDYTNQESYNEQQALFANALTDRTKIKQFIPLGPDKFMYKFLNQGLNEALNLRNSYLPAACFVPSYGRIQLWEQLNKLGDRVIMYDTDSVIFIHDPNEYNPVASKVWGGWEEEDISVKGITGVVCLCPKSYAIRCADPAYNVVKLKGLSQTRSTSKLLTYETAKKMVLDNQRTKEEQVINVPQVTFQYNLGKGMFTRPSLKKLSFDMKNQKGTVGMDYIVYPRGYE
jgi:hypothetical protein